MSTFLGCKPRIWPRVIFLHLVFNFLCVNGVSVTFADRFLAGHVMTARFHWDWLQCTLSCQENPDCVSYNFDKISGTCELNNHGLTTEIDAELALTQAKDFIYHQIRPSGSKSVPRNIVPTEHQCACGCSQQLSGCTPNPNAGNQYLPRSCKELLRIRRNPAPSNGAYDLQIPPHSTKVRVYCHMDEIPGCGGGGWTLVMKINGSKSTFLYESKKWTNMDTYQASDGLSLSLNETKLPTYWALPFTGLCLGMKGNEGDVRWIRLDYAGKSLYDVISTDSSTQTHLPLDTWKSLVQAASIQRNCTKQGFNVKTSAATARIGIIGFPNQCTHDSHSRIGFGTSGTTYGMKNSACGNEAYNNPDNGDKSISTFGYILVQ